MLSKKEVINFYIPGWCLLDGSGSLLGAKYPGRCRIEVSEQTCSSVALYSNSALSLLEGKESEKVQVLVAQSCQTLLRSHGL